MLGRFTVSHPHAYLPAMGYGGKAAERERARDLRAESWTLAEIASELGVAKSSVSIWVRDVEFVPKPRNRGADEHRPHPLRVRKEAEIEAARTEGSERFASLTEDEFFAAGVMLYVGEGSKTPGTVSLANTDPDVIAFFMAWSRHFFDINEAKWRASLYLHEGLNVGKANEFWSSVSGIPVSSFYKPYRASRPNGWKKSKHPMGCFTPKYADTHLHRKVIGFCDGLLSSPVPDPG